MGYKGNNDRGKGKNRTCGKAYWCSRQKITKQKVGENRCNNISFRPLTGYPQRKMWKGIKIEFFPKRRYYIGYGKKLNLSSVYIRRIRESELNGLQIDCPTLQTD